MVKYVTSNELEQILAESKTPVFCDFWATWCGPCRMIAPIIEEIANEADGEYKVGKVNVDEEPELATAFGVSSIPMLVVVKDGKVVNSMVGFRPKEEILELLK